MVIPQFTAQWIQLVKEVGENLQEVSIVLAMHRNGINMRYLGMLYELLEKEENSAAVQGTLHSKCT